MAPKNTISQLDLVLLGRRGLTARLGSMESQVKRLVTGSGGDTGDIISQDLRPNLLTNSSFEYYDRGSTRPQDWAITGSATVSVGSAGVDGTNSLLLPAGASITQAAAAGVTVPHASVVISVAARSNYASQKIAIGLTHGPGASGGPIMRIDLTGGIIQTDDVPADGNWYRFYRQFILNGGGTASAVFAQAGSGTLEIDAAKFEKEDGVAAWLEPTAFVSADWGAATHIRNLAADNIVTGTLVVGGSISANPRILVKDGADVEIVTIGQPTGGFYGIEIKGAAGLRISGTGSAEVLGGGSIQVKGGGDITIDGGDIIITDGGLTVSGSAGILVNGGGNVTIGTGGDLIVLTGGSASIGGPLTVTGTAHISGDTTIDGTTEIGGDLLLSGALSLAGNLEVLGAGIIRVGSTANERIELVAAGLSGYSTVGLQTVLLDAATGKLLIKGAGALDVSGVGGIRVSGGGNITVDDAGDIILTGSGKVLAGPTGGYHAELGAGGLSLYGSTGDETILLSSITGKVHVFDDSLVLEDGGQLTFVSGLVWTDNKGLWMIDGSGNAAFGIAGQDGQAWGNLPGAAPLDKGDVLIGNSSSYVWWDSSASTLKLSGNLYAQNGNISIDESGVYVLLPASQTDTRAFGWKDSGGNIRSSVYGYGSPTDGYLQVDANRGHTSTNGYLNLTSFAAAAGNGTVSLQAMKWNGTSYVSAVGITGDTNTQILYLNGTNGVQVAGGIVKFGSSRRIGLNGSELFVDNGFYFLNTAAPSAPLSRLYATHTNNEFGTPTYTNLTWDGTGILSVPNAPIQAPYFRLNNGQQWYGLTSGAVNYLRGGNVFLDGRLSFASNNPAGAYFYTDDGNRTAHQGNLVVWGDVYVSNAGNWVSAIAANINQAVKTTSSPTFANVTIAGVGTVWGTLTNQAVTTTSQPTFNGILSGEWFRSTVSGQGWYHNVHGGGWYMMDTWIRNYGSHPICISGGSTQAQFQGTEVRVNFSSDQNGQVITQYWNGTNFNWYSSQNALDVMSIYSGAGIARVGIRKTTPGWALEVGLDSAAKPNGGSWINSSSDIRTKTVDSEYEYGLEALRKLRLVRYTYNGKGETVEGLKGVGFVAQEAQQVIPEMVHTRMAKLNPEDEHETELLTLSNDPAIYATMKGVQELADIVDELRAEIEELKSSR